MKAKTFTGMVHEMKLSYKTTAVLKSKITRSADVYEYLKQVYDFETIEHIETAYAIFLNKANIITGYTKLSEGGISGCIIDTRLVMQHALLHNASSIILTHNHPSGNLRPSDADKQVTNVIKEAGKIMGINLIEHLIMSKEGFLSMADEDLI